MKFRAAPFCFSNPDTAEIVPFNRGLVCSQVRQEFASFFEPSYPIAEEVGFLFEAGRLERGPEVPSESEAVVPF